MIPTPTVGHSVRSRAYRALALATVVTLAIGGAVVGVAAPAVAAPAAWTVTSTEDNGNPASCTNPAITVPIEPTLRDAVCAANNRGADSTTITLQAGNYQLSAGNGSLLLGKNSGSNITLQGPSDRSAKIIGDGQTSVLVLDPDLVGGVTTTITGITITGGVGNAFGGGGILGGSAGAGGSGDTLTITNSTITDSRANTTGSATNAPGGGIQFIGGQLSISDSTISDNDSGTSGGGGVAYAATEVVNQKFLVSNTVFSGNSARSNDIAAIGGGAIEFSAGQSPTAVEAKITDSTFSANTVAGAAGKPARGGAILQNSGTLEITGTRFAANTITGAAPAAGAAIHVAGGTLNAHFNSFIGNTGTNANAVVDGDGTTGGIVVNAENNWWNCNRLAVGATGCDTASAGVTAEPSLALSVSANPVLIPLGSSTAVLTASVLKNSTGGVISPASLRIFSDATVAWSGVLPNGATISASSTPLTGGTANTSFDAHALRGPASVTAGLGNAKAVASFGMAKVPEFPGLVNLDATIGVPVSATVRSDGYPFPALTVSGVALPAGLTFVDNGNGTATISGTPSATGITNTSLTAVNSVGTTPQAYTVTVRQPVAFTSAPAATFTVDQPGTHTISTTGFPLSALVTSGAALPGGVSVTGGAAGQATALLSGTPAAGSGGVYALSFTRNNGRDADVAQNFTLTVNEKPAFSSPPSGALHVGDATNLSFAAGGGYPNDAKVTLAGALPAGVTTVVDPERGVTGLQGTPDAGAGGVYTITLTATNSAGLSVPQTVTLTVNEDAYISVEPGDAAVLVGNTASFTVGVGGYPAPSGVWQRSTNNGLSWTDLLETGPTLTVATSQADNGSVYRYFVTLAAKSRAALLTVGTGPVIGSAGAASWAVDSAEHSFDVFASGIPDATITVTPTAPATVPGWLSVGTSEGGRLTISGTPPVGAGGVYVFDVAASNVFGTTAASTLSITVLEAPVINAPSGLSLEGGTPMSSLSVTASGGYPVSASLELDPSSTIPAGVNVAPGGNDDAFTLSGTPTVGGDYVLTFTAKNSPTGPASTVQLPIRVTTAPIITAPNAIELALGGSDFAQITVTPGFPTATTMGLIGAPSGFSLTGSAPDSYRLAADATVAAGDYSFQLRAWNGVLASTKNISVTVRQAPAVTVQPLPQTVTAGAMATFTATASAAVPSTGTMTAQWQRSGDGSTWTDVPGGTLNAGVASLSFTATQLMSGAQYRVVVTDGASATSAAATLTVGTPPQLTSAASAPFEVGIAGSVTVTATGTPTPAISAGGLPAGLGFVDNGNGIATISGTPEPGTGGTHTVTIGAANGFGVDAAQPLDVVIAEKPAITSASTATAPAGAPLSFTVTSSAGYPGAVTLALGGTLPTGVSYVDNGDGTATIAGTPAAATGGDYALTLTATNGAGSSAQSFTLTVTEDPAITSADAATIGVGSAATFTVTSSPGHSGAVTLTEGGALPAGVTFTDNGDGTATFGGAAAVGTGGAYPLTLTATNGTGSSAQSFTLTVTEDPAITSADAATITVGDPATVTVTSSPGYSGAVELSVTGALPKGVTFTDNGDGTAVLGGTPKAGSGGDYALALKVKNASGAVTQAFALTVTEKPAIGSADSVLVKRGVLSSFAVTTDGGFPHAITLAITGALPDGLSFSDAGDGTASIRGTTTAPAGDYPVTLTATNAAGLRTTQTLTVTLEELPVVMPPATVPGGSGALEGVPADATPGTTLDVSAFGFAPDSPVVFSIYSSPTVLATVTADAAGVARATVTIPAGYSGTHSIVASGTSPTGNVLFMRSDVTVTADDGGTDPGGNPGGTPGGEKPATGAGLPASGFDGGALFTAALALLLIGGAVVVTAVLRRRRTRTGD
ncbi:beta strand repeat-containing protein [Microterricola gilva]|nr:putative Ig domain-containing protein [Microterricola gilva]